MIQLTIFDTLVENTAYDLLGLLNEGLKGKEVYKLQYAIKAGIYVIIVATNANKTTWFNILQNTGEMPKGFCVNWRNWQHIQQEVKL